MGILGNIATFVAGSAVPAAVLTLFGFATAGPAGGSLAAWLQSKSC